MAERVEDGGEPVARDEGLGGLADRGTGLLGSGHHLIDVGAVQPDRMGCGGSRRRGGDLIGLLRVSELQPTGTEVQFRMCDGAVGSVHPLDDLSAEYVLVERDRLGSSVDADERGQAGVALRNGCDTHVDQFRRL